MSQYTSCADLHDCDHVDEAARQWVEEAGQPEPEVPGAEGDAT